MTNAIGSSSRICLNDISSGHPVARTSRLISACDAHVANGVIRRTCRACGFRTPSSPFDSSRFKSFENTGEAAKSAKERRKTRRRLIHYVSSFRRISGAASRVKQKLLAVAQASCPFCRRTGRMPVLLFDHIRLRGGGTERQVCILSSELCQIIAGHISTGVQSVTVRPMSLQANGGHHALDLFRRCSPMRADTRPGRVPLHVRVLRPARPWSAIDDWPP